MDYQSYQLENILSEEEKYKETGDIDSYIKFWEDIWNDGGLSFSGSRWTFRLCDLYYKAKRYDDAWGLLNRIILETPYVEKARCYQIKILKREHKDYTHIVELLCKEFPELADFYNKKYKS